jgi:hypothetical protein
MRVAIKPASMVLGALAARRMMIKARVKPPL